MTVVKCNDCGTILDEPSDTPAGERTPCPSCGSKARLFEVKLENSISIHDKLGVKARPGSGGKPFYESVTGDVQNNTGLWMRLERIIDRVKDYYKEKVIDPRTGQIVHECEEPLSQHTDHGSAKQGKER